MSNTKKVSTAYMALGNYRNDHDIYMETIQELAEEVPGLIDLIEDLKTDIAELSREVENQIEAASEQEDRLAELEKELNDQLAINADLVEELDNR